jgi:hypothetical protein
MSQLRNTFSKSPVPAWCALGAITLVILLTTCSIAQAATYSRAKTRAIVTEAGRYYGLSRSERIWLKRAAIDIIYDGAHESSGGALTGLRKSCKGILQYDGGWNQVASVRRHGKHHNHRNGDWRLCGDCSLWRFVRTYDVGGKAAIRKHWKATLGH